MTVLPRSDPPRKIELLDIETFRVPRRLTAADLRAQTGGWTSLSSHPFSDDHEDDR